MHCSKQPQLRLVAAGKLIPHVKKVEAGGDDAFFVTAAGLGALGIAEGVPAWQESAPSSAGDYARAMISRCAKAFEQAPAAARGTCSEGSCLADCAATVIPDPADVMAAAQDSTSAPGSAPLLLAALQHHSKLQVASIGDGGALLLRGGGVVSATERQGHGAADADTPHQLPHPEFAKPGQQADTAHGTARSTWEVQEGDVLIAGSDGLFDNLFTHDMLLLAHQALSGYTSAAQHLTRSTSSSSSSAGRSPGRGWEASAAQPAAAAAVEASDNAGADAAAGREAECIQAAVKHAAELLAAAAAKNAASRWARVPAAQPAGAGAGCLLPWLVCRGGKMDDITCVVALVTQRGVQPSSTCSDGSAAPAAVAAAAEGEGGDAAAEYQECIEQQQEGPMLRASSAASLQSCHSQGAAAAAAAGVSEISAGEIQPQEVAAPAAGKEIVHCTLPAAAAAGSPAGATGGVGQQAGSAMHVARPAAQGSSADSSISCTSSYSRNGSSGSSRSSSLSHVSAAASSAAAGSSSRPSSAAGSYSSASDGSVPLVKAARASSAGGQLRLMPKSNGSTSCSTAGSVAGSASGGHYLRAPKLGDSPTHVKREASRRHTPLSRMFAPSAAAAAAAGGGDRVGSNEGSKQDVDGASVQQQRQRQLAPTGAAVRSAAAAAAAAEAEDAAEKVPAGKDSAGRQLYVGSRVAVMTELGVAAVGRVKLLPGQKVDRWMDDKVWPQHLGVGDIRVGRDMQEVAQQAKFWVKCEGHGLYGNHPAYTFWSKRQQLQEKRICMSIPCSSLKLIE
ncbi:hypothetical protein COO60DRAFT_447718 [Scenedesmus sp. NREL 46B-D3]|nr:hypothetical protein COO60DRAFT_447718 [Scenedesmus sp. NREL 46B-D3]